MLVFFRCVAEAVMENGVKGLASLVPGGEFACKVAAGAYQKYRERKEKAEQRKEIEALAQAHFESAKQEAIKAIGEAVAEVARTSPQQAALSESDRQHLETYLSQVPAAVQQSLKRPEDPAGRTVPAAFVINTPDDVAKLLPPRAPRFKPGDPLAGKPGWVLERPLGVGGFGEVWLARHERLASLGGAVKFCLGPQARDIQHESGVIDRVMQAGRHPHIVPLIDVSLEGHTPWLMYEYVPGGDLADLVRRWQGVDREKRVQTAIVALRQLCGAVAHFHRLRPAIVHRDLKPANILFDRANKRLRVTDFGIGAVAAKAALNEEARGGTTAVGRLMSYMRGSHTPLYASPQQRAGADPDPRDDVHALGVLAFQMLTGRLDAEVKGNWQRRLQSEGVPAALIDLIGNSASDEAEDRPGDAREWEEALARAVTPPPAPPPAVVSPAVHASSAGAGEVGERPSERAAPDTMPKPPPSEMERPGAVDDTDRPRLMPNALAILKALKKRGAVSEGTAVSKYLLMDQDGVGPHCYNLEDEGLIGWVEQLKSPVPELTKSK